MDPVPVPVPVPVPTGMVAPGPGCSFLPANWPIEGRQKAGPLVRTTPANGNGTAWKSGSAENIPTVLVRHAPCGGTDAHCM